MRMRSFPGWIGMLVLASAATIGAQQSPADKTGPAAEGQKPPITVAGCVQKERSVLKRAPAAGQIGEIGLTDEFVLTNVRLNPKPMDEPNPEALPPAGTSGSLGNFGKVYRVTGDKENELRAHVGQRVEISGTFKREDDAKTELSTVGTSGRVVTGELTTANTPEITITSVKPVAGLCSSGVAR
jgi:hypothetical protein